MGGRAEQSRWFNSKEGRERPFDLTAVSLNLEKLWAVSPYFHFYFVFFFSFSFSFILQHFSNGHTTPTSPTTRLFPLLVCPPLRLCAYLFLPIELEQHRARFRHQINFFFPPFFFFFYYFVSQESRVRYAFISPILSFPFFTFYSLSLSVCRCLIIIWIESGNGRRRTDAPNPISPIQQQQKKLGKKERKSLKNDFFPHPAATSLFKIWSVRKIMQF